MKTERSRLIRRLDSYFSKFIRNRDNNVCFTCGKPASDNGHYIPRARTQFRWDEKNCNAQCKHCNWTLEGNKDIYRKKLIAKYGKDFIELIEAESHKNYHFPLSDIKILIEVYRPLIEKLNKE